MFGSQYVNENVEEAHSLLCKSIERLGTNTEDDELMAKKTLEEDYSGQEGNEDDEQFMKCEEEV